MVWGAAVGVVFAFLGVFGVEYYVLKPVSRCLPEKESQTGSVLPLGGASVDLCPEETGDADAAMGCLDNGKLYPGLELPTYFGRCHFRGSLRAKIPIRVAALCPINLLVNMKKGGKGRRRVSQRSKYLDLLIL